MKYWRWLIPGIILIACTAILLVQGNPFSTKPKYGYEAVLGDLDGDGDTDAFITAGAGVFKSPNTIWINQGGLQGNSQGNFIASIQPFDTQDSRSAALGDLDNDGDLDILIGKASGFEVYLNSGGPQGGWKGNFQLWKSQTILNEPADFFQIALGDLDGDGDLDAFMGTCCSQSTGNSTWLNGGSADFSNSGQYLDDAPSSQVALGDLDGDDDLDALILKHRPARGSTGNPEGDPSIQVWLNDGSGRFTDSGERLGDSGSELIVLEDLDGDSDLDVYIAGGNSLSVWVNDGAGRFRSSAPRTSQLVAQTILLGDLDQDTDPDVLISSGDMVEVWVNDGGGVFELSAQRINLPKYSAVALGDLDGDDDLDLFSGYLNERYRIWWNDGFGRLGLSWR